MGFFGGLFLVQGFFGGFVGSLRDFFGSWFLPSFDHRLTILCLYGRLCCSMAVTVMNFE